MATQLGFHGASGTVTGSCYLIEHDGRRVLVDCGMFQGTRTLSALNEKPFPFDAASIDAVLLTHAHIDHSGLLPKLTAAGYRGPIHATAPTNDLLAAMLPDSAHIQESDAESQNRRNRRRGRPAVKPLYTIEDAERCLTQLKDVPFDAVQDIRAGPARPLVEFRPSARLGLDRGRDGRRGRPPARVVLWRYRTGQQTLP